MNQRSDRPREPQGYDPAMSPEVNEVQWRYRSQIEQKQQAFQRFLSTLHLKLGQLDLTQQTITAASDFILNQTQTAFDQHQKARSNRISRMEDAQQNQSQIQDNTDYQRTDASMF